MRKNLPYLYGLERQQQSRADQADMSVGGQRSCEYWANRRKGNEFTFDYLRNTDNCVAITPTHITQRRQVSRAATR